MESIVVVLITEVVTLAVIIVSSSKSRTVTECKIYALAEKVAKHNRLIEPTYELILVDGQQRTTRLNVGLRSWSAWGPESIRERRAVLYNSANRFAMFEHRPTSA